ncbi:PREDICTED: uncharacterized protein C19orf45 homolog, partial [Nestor notabilis]|uniref:uncharacterized protein C19orf45 homolog n=1 Tax=Nestor notabilis TaxID=176057 RepID=UPI000523B91C
CDPAVKGDGQSCYHASHQARFKGEWSPPAKPSEKHTSIKFGDPRIGGSMSEQKHAYSAPGNRTHRAYDKEHAASQIQHTNEQLGDGCTRFSTSTSTQFPAYDLGKPDLLLHKQPTKLCLGHEHPGSRWFSTTQQSDYHPPRQSERVVADRRSHIPFHCHNECSVSTMKATLVPHRQKKQRPSEEMLQQIKYSQPGRPWRAQDLLSTEQKDQFTPKFRGPADIQNFQVSCIPLGTLNRHCPQRK